MQIHEMTMYKSAKVQEGWMDTVKAVAANPKALVDPVAYGQAQQVGRDASAGKAAASLEKKGFGTQYQEPSSRWQDKLTVISKNPNTIQYVNNLAAKWAKDEKAVTTSAMAPGQTPPPVAPATPPVATAAGAPPPTNYNKPAYLRKQQAQTPPASTPPASTPPASTPPQNANEPISVGGEKLNPKNPTDAAILSALRKQGSINEAVQNPNDYKYAFMDWADSQLKTRNPATYDEITMNDVRKAFPDLKTKLLTQLDAIAQTQGTDSQKSAVIEYLKLAMSGIQALAQEQKNKVPSASRAAVGRASSVQQSLQQKITQLGVTPQQLQQMGQMMRVSGGEKTFKSTGNVQADALLMAMGLKPQ